MVIRFTAFIKHDNQEVNLYVMQENQESEDLCFRVHVTAGEKSVLSLCKVEEHKWKISPQELPQWLDDIKPLMISVIESKLIKNDTKRAKS